MATLANLLVSMKADFNDTDVGLEKLIKSFLGVKGASEEAGHGLEEAKKKGEESADGLEKLNESFEDLIGEIVKFSLETTSLISVFEMLKESIEVSAEIESSRVALEAFTGSAEKATDVIEDMEHIAKSEALAFPEVIPAAQHFMALGFSAEETAKAISVAGNASWALGQPLEEVSQRIAMIAMSGMVSARYLRTLGISVDDLGKSMGVSGAEVEKAFHAISQTDRLEALLGSLERFGEVGKKEAETTTGKWIELKNTWHEAFQVMGDDIKPVTNLLEGFGTMVGNVFGNAAKSIGDLAATAKAFWDMMEYHERKGVVSTPSNVHQIPWPGMGGKGVEGLPPEAGTTGPVGEDRGGLAKDVSKALAQERAKENAGAELAIINAKREANTALAALDKERVTSAIDAAHTVRQANIDADVDILTRAKNTADEEVRTAKEKREKLSSIAIAEAQQNAALLNRQRQEKIAQTYELGRQGEEDPETRAAKIRTIDAETAAERQKIAEKLSKELEGYADDELRAFTHSLIGISTVNRSVTEKMNTEWESTFTKLEKQLKDFGEEYQKEVNKQAVSNQEAQSKATVAGGTQTNTRAKQEEERRYGLEIIHTLNDQIAHIAAIAGYEENILRLKADQLNADADIAAAAGDTAKAEELRTEALDLQNQALNKQYDAQTQILELKKQESLLNQLGGEVTRTPQAVGSAFTQGLFERHRTGMGHPDTFQNIEKALTQAFKGIGKEMLGTVIQHLFADMVKQLAANTAIQAIMHALGLTSLPVQTANTIALTANTTAQGLLITSNALLISSISALIISLAVNSATNLFSFGEGGSPEPGKPAIIGEKGPELWVPREAGNIYSNKAMINFLGGGTPNVTNFGGSSNQSLMIGNVHLPNVRDVQGFARQLPDYLKSRGVGAVLGTQKS